MSAMQDKGLKSVRVLHRLSSPRHGERELEDAAHRLRRGREGRHDSRAHERLEADPLRVKGAKVGKPQMLDGKLVDGPMDFARKNAISLVDLQNALVWSRGATSRSIRSRFELTDARSSS
jgi:hypothetical protein